LTSPAAVWPARGGPARAACRRGLCLRCESALWIPHAGNVNPLDEVTHPATPWRPRQSDRPPATLRTPYRGRGPPGPTFAAPSHDDHENVLTRRQQLARDREGD